MNNIMEPKVLIVILNYKTYNMTLELVEQLKEIDYHNYQILVVDNCSPNDSGKILARYSKEMHYIMIENDKNSGYAAGNNVGIHFGIENGYKYTWILNNDVKLIDKQILSKLVDRAESDKKIACVGPQIMSVDEVIVAPYIERPTRWSMTLGIVAAKKRRLKKIEKSGIVYRVFGCCMLLKNSYMEKIGCMDERTFLYCEEAILAERLRNVDGYSYYCANANIIHLESMTVKKEYRNRNREKAKIMLESMDLYLRDYLHYGPISRMLCKLGEYLLIYFRR